MHRHRPAPRRGAAVRVPAVVALIVGLVAVPVLVLRRLGAPVPDTAAWHDLWAHHRATAGVVVPVGEAVFLALWCWFGVTLLAAVAGRARLGIRTSADADDEAEPGEIPERPIRHEKPAPRPPVRAVGPLPPSASAIGVWQELPWSDEDAGRAGAGDEPEILGGAPGASHGPMPSDEPAPWVDLELSGSVVVRPDEAPVAAEPGEPPTGCGFDPEPEWDVLVTVMGLVSAVDRDGRPARFEKSKSLELLAWLTQHRERPTRGAARTALWDTAVRDSTFANVVSDLRRGLARLAPPPGDDEWIGRTLTDDLPLHPRVRTDADLLQARLAAARGCDDRTAAELLRPGLALVTGMPFSGAGTSFTWADGEGHTSSVVLTITTAATELAERLLRLDDIDGVFWATGQGLKVLPGQEELIALRMQAHAARGDLAGVRLEWDQYERSLGADPWEQAAPSPKLTSLRRSLLTAGGPLG